MCPLENKSPCIWYVRVRLGAAGLPTIVYLGGVMSYCSMYFVPSKAVVLVQHTNTFTSLYIFQSVTVVFSLVSLQTKIKGWGSVVCYPSIRVRCWRWGLAQVQWYWWAWLYRQLDPWWANMWELPYSNTQIDWHFAQRNYTNMAKFSHQSITGLQIKGLITE